MAQAASHSTAELLRSLPFEERSEAQRNARREQFAAAIARADTTNGVVPNLWHHLKPRIRSHYRSMADALLTGFCAACREEQANG